MQEKLYPVFCSEKFQEIQLIKTDVSKQNGLKKLERNTQNFTPGKRQALSLLSLHYD